MKKDFGKIYFAINCVYSADSFVFFISVFSMAVSGINPVVNNLVIAKMVELFQANTISRNNLLVLVTIILGINSMGFILSNLREAFSETLGNKLSNDVENMVVEKSQKIPQYIMDDPHYLDLYKNTTERVSFEPINLFHNLLDVFSSTVTIIGYIVVLISFSVWAPFLLMISLIPVYFLRKKAQIKDHNNFKSTVMISRQTRYHFALLSDKKYAHEIRIFGLFDFLKKERNRLFGLYMQERRNTLIYKTLMAIFTGFFILSGSFIIEFWVVNPAVQGALSLSQFVLFNNTAASLTIRFLSIIDRLILSKRSLQFLDFLFDFLNLDEIKTHDDLKIVDRIDIVEFDSVYFKYPNSKEYCLRNVNLKFRANQKICLVGENGSGKSTLIKLLLRVYEPSRGKILINGIDIQKFNLEEYYKKFSVMLQEYSKYALDVQKCIGFGNIEKLDDLDEIKKAAEKSNADRFIEKYRMKYVTNLSHDFYEDATEPSIGQWQKLAISRALFSKSQVLIMDEPTSALDPNSEEQVFKSIDNCRSGIVIFISHKMSSAKKCNNVVVLHKGSVVEYGPHEELMLKNNFYRKMYNLQAEKYN